MKARYAGGREFVTLYKATKLSSLVKAAFDESAAGQQNKASYSLDA